MAVFRKIGSHLIASDDVQLGPGGLEFPANRRELAEHHFQAGLCLEEGRIGHVAVRLDGDAFVIEAFGEEALFGRIDGDPSLRSAWVPLAVKPATGHSNRNKRGNPEMCRLDKSFMFNTFQNIRLAPAVAG